MSNAIDIILLMLCVGIPSVLIFICIMISWLMSRNYNDYKSKISQLRDLFRDIKSTNFSTDTTKQDAEKIILYHNKLSEINSKPSISLIEEKAGIKWKIIIDSKNSILNATNATTPILDIQKIDLMLSEISQAYQRIYNINLILYLSELPITKPINQP